ncbi:hypothetical protein Ae201684_005604 [Aphanomyces euteiches]|uniref:Uncharacterized protein n=1 Tax=Aphanomyces euteiches TaxID=100861 RepID=A0A6G0XEL1_9STRA|nr:hypothetical protein Ae201684_005604 [Aphanomyces euteiches]
MGDKLLQRATLVVPRRSQGRFFSSVQKIHFNFDCWRLIHNSGMTWRVIERRAIQIHQQDICRFVNELDSVIWSQRNLVFLDEVSFDNRGMLRRRGYAMRGERVIIRGRVQ